MSEFNPHVSKYIATAPRFAQPILEHLRAVVHAACPDVEESMKWSRPHFNYHGMLAGMSAFKEHCTFGFWKGELVLADHVKDGAQGQFGRITSIKDLPSKRVITAYIKHAAQLNLDGVAAPRAIRTKSPQPISIPDALFAAFGKHRNVRAAFDALSPSHQREYCEWIANAKRPATVASRVEKTIAQLQDGKSLNWKYERRVE